MSRQEMLVETREDERNYSYYAAITAKVGGATAALGSGAAFGAYVANKYFPPNVELGQGVSVDASLTGHQGTTVALGPPELHLPNLPSGVKLDITKIDFSLSNPHWFDQYAGLVTQYNSGIVEPIKHALIERLALGAGMGAATVGAIGATAIHVTRLRRENKELRHELGQEEDTRTSHNSSKWRRVKRSLAPIALAASIAAGCGAAYDQVSNESDAKVSTTALPLEATELSPVLKGATVSGPAGELIKTAVYGGVKYIEGVDESWDESRVNLEASFLDFEKSGHMDYLNNKDIVPIMHISDIHCNFPYLKRYFPSLVQKFQPQVIANTGDTFTNSNTAPYEKNCYSTFRDKVAEADRENGTNTTIVNVMGNHDQKEPINISTNPKVMTLDEHNRYHAKVDGINFVGDSDPESTIWSVPKENQQDELERRIRAQGEHIADKACEITEKTGIPPIVLAHRMQALYKTITKGCASIANNGHTHIETDVKNYESDSGKEVLQHTGGSASGAFIGPTPYEYVQQDAPITIELYSKKTDSIVGYIIVTLHTDKNSTIEYRDVPQITESVSETEKMQEYLQIK
jgi:Icc-related predicted phosphoesterase